MRDLHQPQLRLGDACSLQNIGSTLKGLYSSVSREHNPVLFISQPEYCTGVVDRTRHTVISERLKVPGFGHPSKKLACGSQPLTFKNLPEISINTWGYSADSGGASEAADKALRLLCAIAEAPIDVRVSVAKPGAEHPGHGE